MYNILIVYWMHRVSDKKSLFLADSKKKNYFQKSIKKLLNPVVTKEENWLFYIDKNISMNNHW